MGTKWSSTSISGYNASPPSDDGAQTEANKVKYSTITTNLTDPLNSALSTTLSRLNELLEEAPKAQTGNYTTVSSDNARTIECNGTFNVTLLAPATGGTGYKVRVKNVGSGIITVIGTIDGGAYYVLRPKSGATFEVNAAANAYMINGSHIGKFLQERRSTPYTSYTDLSTQIATTDTIPTTSNGFQVASVAITPTHTDSVLVLDFSCFGAIANAGSVCAALFSNASTNAIETTAAGGSAGAQMNVHLHHERTAGGVAEITFTIRVGPNSAAGNFYINGNSTNRLFGGTGAARLIVREYAA